MAKLFIIRELIAIKKTTIKAVANEAGVSENTIQNMINKNTAKVDSVERIAKVLNVPVSVFFNDEVQGDYENNEFKNKYYQTLEKLEQVREKLEKYETGKPANKQTRAAE